MDAGNGKAGDGEREVPPKPLLRPRLGLDPVRGIGPREPEDFRVEEILAYEPCGEGTHHFLRVEKTGLTTFEAVRRLGRALGRPESDFGYAGLKDRRAVTVQTISIEHAEEEGLRRLEIEGLEILGITRHRNKVKLGHLSGNRFRLRIRACRRGDGERARAILDVLARKGLPNVFGPQRFGARRATPELGRLLLAGEEEAFLGRCLEIGLRVPEGRTTRRRIRRLPRRFLSLCTASVQAEVFNRVLERRLPDLDRLQEGDLAFLHRNGAVFRVLDPEAERERARSFEISPSGPLPGPEMPRPGGAPAALEDEVCDALGVDPRAFALHAPWAQKGGRRPLRVPVLETRVREASDGKDTDLELSFRLPRGSYATAVLAEVLEEGFSASSESLDPRRS